MKKTITLLICLAFSFTACSSKKGGGGSTVTTVSYYQADGECYENKTNKHVDLDKCDGVTYYMEGQSCYTKAGDDYVEDFDKCTANLSTYFYIGGHCVDKSNDYDQVSKGKCTTSDDDDDRYTKDGNYCYDNEQEEYVDITLCLEDDGDDDGDNSGSCYGTFVKVRYDSSKGKWFTDGYITCNGSNCADKMLWNPRTSQYAYCK